MECTRNTHIELTNLGLLLKEKLSFIEHETAQANALKEEIRGIMIENDAKEFENPDLDLFIKCSRSFSFDIGLLKYSERMTK